MPPSHVVGLDVTGARAIHVALTNATARDLTPVTYRQIESAHIFRGVVAAFSAFGGASGKIAA